MTLQMYSIFDTVAQVYNGVNLEINEGSAIRNFANSCVPDNSVLHNFGSNYELVYLGTFNTATGEVVADDHKTLINGTAALAMVTKGE